MRQTRRWSVLLPAGVYLFTGIGTAIAARGASTPAGATGWRLTAWLLSLAVFMAHFAMERRARLSRRQVAARVALAVALGALGVAALGPFRAHWGEPHMARLAAFSLVAWPLLTGAPAYLLAWVAGLAIDRATRDLAGAPRP